MPPCEVFRDAYVAPWRAWAVERRADRIGAECRRRVHDCSISLGRSGYSAASALRQTPLARPSTRCCRSSSRRCSAPGAASLGVIEGAAEAANSLLKIVSGRMADRMPRKRPLVLIGYGLSSLVRPLIALTTTWTQVLAVRVIDRVGKGVRGAPREAMLAAWATPTTRGRVYGLQRGMDHLGAVIGPALATLFLIFYPATIGRCSCGRSCPARSPSC
jgi:MFS family permease